MNTNQLHLKIKGVRTETRCACCGRKLKNKESVRWGIGRSCIKKYPIVKVIKNYVKREMIL